MRSQRGCIAMLMRRPGLQRRAKRRMGAPVDALWSRWEARARTPPRAPPPPRARVLYIAPELTDILLLELSRSVTLDEGGLSHSSVTDEDELEARGGGLRLLQSAGREGGGGGGGLNTNRERARRRKSASSNKHARMDDDSAIASHVTGAAAHHGGSAQATRPRKGPATSRWRPRPAARAWMRSFHRASVVCTHHVVCVDARR